MTQGEISLSLSLFCPEKCIESFDKRWYYFFEKYLESETGPPRFSRTPLNLNARFKKPRNESRFFFLHAPHTHTRWLVYFFERKCNERVKAKLWNFAIQLALPIHRAHFPRCSKRFFFVKCLALEPPRVSYVRLDKNVIQIFLINHVWQQCSTPSSRDRSQLCGRRVKTMAWAPWLASVKRPVRFWKCDPTLRFWDGQLSLSIAPT